MGSVTVVIPSYNRVGLLSRALDSVFAQTRLPDEVIVVDDGSTDGTFGMVESNYPGVRVISQNNAGVSSARNRGIKAATSDWIALLDSDDEWQTEKLAKQLQLIEQDPSARVVHTNEKWVRNGKHLNQMEKHKKHGGWIFKKCLPLCVISPSSVMLYRSVFDELGLFDESLPACEDYDMWLKVASRYYIHFIDEALITKYGGHEDQLSHQHWGMDRFRILALKNIVSSGTLDAEDKEAAINVLESKIDIYSAGASKRGKWEDVAIYNSIKQKVSFPQRPKQK